MQISSPPEAVRPRFWKHFALTFGVVYPTQQAMTKGLVSVLRPWIEGMPAWSRDVATVALICLVLMKALPVVYRAGNAWMTR